VAALAALAVAGAGQLGVFNDPPPPPRTVGDALTYDQAHDQLVALTVVERPGSMAGYDRDARFGDWLDLDGDGCDTREEVLMRDAAEYTRVHYGDRCVGTLHLEDPYGQGPIEVLGNIQIDHVVSLAAAWRAGASGWTDAQRRAFTNDEANLLAVDSGENQSKGDQTPDEWMPPAAFRCSYVKIYIDTSARYRLAVTEATMNVLRDVLLEECPRQR
jgi:hypothetical protein